MDKKLVNPNVVWHKYPDEKPQFEGQIKEFLVRGISPITKTPHAFVFNWLNVDELPKGWYYNGQEARNYFDEPFEWLDVSEL